MDFTRRKEELVKEFSPMLEKNNLRSKIWIGSLIVIVLIGLYAFYVQATKGHTVTG